MIKISQLALVALVLSLYLVPFLVQARQPTHLQQLKEQIKAKILASPKLRSKLLNFSIKQIEGTQDAAKIAASRVGSSDLCPLCINLLDQTINQLVNIILNAGVIGGCGDLCNYLSGVCI